MLAAVDIETYDPLLKTRGDGSCAGPADGPAGEGRVLCAGVYSSEYEFAASPGTSEWDRLREIMADPNTDKILHNGIYDLAWLVCRYGMEVRGLMHDTMTRMTYIDEYADLDLDSCCGYFGLPGKNRADTIEVWYKEHMEDILPAAKAAGVQMKRSDSLWKHSGWLWDTRPDFRENMIRYNLQDCRATYGLYLAQEPRMRPVYDAYMTDTKLVPLVIEMKKRGVLVDRAAMAELRAVIRRDIDEKLAVLEGQYGVTEEMLSAPARLGARLNEMGIHSPVRTSTGAESWSADAKARLVHYPVMPLIIETQGYMKLLGTYLEGSMAEAVLGDGRIHCTFSPNKREDGGTVTGRFACSKPNLQQIPARDKQFGHNYGQAMRSLFLPDEGCMMSALDYSQIEYLLLAHFAVGPQAEWFREQANAGVDFHTVAMRATGIPSRQVVKTFNYGVIYGMGWRTALEKNYVLFEKMATEKGETPEKFTRETYDGYHERLPVIRDTMRAVQDAAAFQGYVTTIGGRRQHKPRPRYDPLTGRVNDFMYKMLNKLIQGSAADILKAALLRAYEGGVFGTLRMHLTVHDENVVSVPYNREGAEANAALKEYMDGSFRSVLKVPMKAECELGPTWGYWDGDIWSDMRKGIFNRRGDCWWGRR